MMHKKVVWAGIATAALILVLLGTSFTAALAANGHGRGFSAASAQCIVSGHIISSPRDPASGVIELANIEINAPRDVCTGMTTG